MIISILVLTIILSVIALFLINKFPKIKVLLSVIMIIMIIGLGVMVIMSIRKPIEFNKERETRENATIEKMKIIRNIQAAYKNEKGEYAKNFDKLLKFVEKDSFALTDYVEPFPGAWNQDSIKSKKKAVQLGLLQEVTVKKSVYDSLCKGDYDLQNLRYIPYTDNVEFELDAGEVLTLSKVTVKVYELYAPYKTLFDGLDEQLVINYIDQRKKITDTEGLQVGSLDVATNNEGNWE